MINRTFYVLLLSCLFIINCSEVFHSSSLSLTIYNNNFGVVKDTRLIQFDKGTSSIFFTDVAKTIQAETVSFNPINKTVGISLYEQNYQDNLANKYAILSKYIGKSIKVYVKFGTMSKNVEGILLAYSPAFLIKTADGVNIYDSVEGIELKELPQGFLTHPTLIWKCFSQEDIKTEFEVSYRASGFSWKADYIVTLNKNQSSLDFAGWVTIDNRSGKKYSNAKLKLIAGEVNLAKTVTPRRVVMYKKSRAVSGSVSSFQEKTFGDYHMYSLDRRVDVNQSSSKQIEFIQKAYSVSVDKYYVININTGGYGRQKINSVSTLQFQNTKNNFLGIPLPKGIIRVFQRDDADSSLEFIGEDSINHTPKDEKVKIKTGNAFDITTKLIAVNRKGVTNGYDADMKLEINNHGQKLAKFKIEINNPYGNNLKLYQTGNTKSIIKKQNANKFILKLQVNTNTKQTIQWSQTYRY